MSVGDLLRYLFMAAVAFVLLFVGLKIWGKQKAEKRVVRELRVLANPTSSFEQLYAEDAQKALFQSMAILYRAQTRLKTEPGEILQQVFHGKGDGALFPSTEFGRDSYVDPRETLIRDGLLRNYQHCRTLGLFDDSGSITALELGEAPDISAGPASGATVHIRHIIDPAVSPGVEKLIPNMVISPPIKGAKGKSTDLEIKQAKSLASLLTSARLIERDAEDRIIEHYDKINASPEPEPEPEPAPTPKPEPKPETDDEPCPFGKPLPN
ncbi:MAG: hypothetical protein VCA37_09150 [Roseibacillus sp.]